MSVGSIDMPQTMAAPDRSSSGSFGRFAAKTVTVVAAVTIGLWIIIGQVFDRLDDMIDRGTMELQGVVQSATHIGGRSFWTRLQKELDRAASPANDLSPAEKQKLLADIRVLSERYRPFVSEASLLFADKPAEAANKTK
jgi:hypothetical protein